MSGDVLGLDLTRCHTARKSHGPGSCCLCSGAIEPGQRYCVGITFPGEGSYPIGGGDYETESWDFWAAKAHLDCYNREMSRA